MLNARVNLVAHQAGNEFPDFWVIEEPYDLVAVAVHPSDDELFEFSVEDVSEVVDGIGLPGITHRFVRSRIGTDLIPEEFVGVGEFGPEPFVEHIDDTGQRNLFIFDAPGPDVGRSFQRAGGAGLQRDATLTDLLEPVKLQSHIVIEVETPGSFPNREFGFEEPQVGIKLFELAVSKWDDLREE